MQGQAMIEAVTAGLMKVEKRADIVNHVQYLMNQASVLRAHYSKGEAKSILPAPKTVSKEVTEMIAALKVLNSTNFSARMNAILAKASH